MKYLFILMMSLLLFSCDDKPTADQTDADRQEQLQKEAQAQAGLPAIHNFQEKKQLKMIYELRDDAKTVNYAYLWNEFNGKLVFIGKCVGFGIPYSTQYSNPEKLEWLGSGHGAITIPQAEPNGLFMPSSSEGTWLMLLDPQGNPHPTYIEPRIVVSPFEINTR